MKDWWETAYTQVNSNCTRDQVMRALNKTLAITPETYALMENSSAVSYSGMVRVSIILLFIGRSFINTLFMASFPGSVHELSDRELA